MESPLGGRKRAECVRQRLPEPGCVDSRLEPRVVVLVQQTAARDCDGDPGGALLVSPLGRGSVGGDAEQPGRPLAPGRVVAGRGSDQLDERLRDGIREILGRPAPPSEESRDCPDVP